MGYIKKIIHDYDMIYDKNNKNRENREVIIDFSKCLMFLLNFYILLFVLNINIFISLVITHIFNKLFWNVFNTWYIIDLIQSNFIYWEDRYINKVKYITLISLMDLCIKIKEDYKNRDKLNIYNIISKLNIYSITRTIIPKLLNIWV